MIKVSEENEFILIQNHASDYYNCRIFSFAINCYLYTLDNIDAVVENKTGYIKINKKLITDKEYKRLIVILTRYNAYVEKLHIEQGGK